VPLCSVTPTGHRGFGSGFHPYLSRFADRCHPGAPRKGHPSRAGLRDPHGQHVRLSALHSTFLQLLSPHPATPAETSPRPRRGKPRRTPRLVPQNRLGGHVHPYPVVKEQASSPGFTRVSTPFFTLRPVRRGVGSTLDPTPEQSSRSGIVLIRPTQGPNPQSIAPFSAHEEGVSSAKDDTPVQAVWFRQSGSPNLPGSPLPAAQPPPPPPPPLLGARGARGVRGSRSRRGGWRRSGSTTFLTSPWVSPALADSETRL
jgi:hypothetical protein